MWASRITIEEETDPVQIARVRETLDHFTRNSDWLAAHWANVLPQARGKFIAVAGQEAFIAETPQGAWEWAAKAHPEDKGPLVQYVRTGQGPRFYGNRWRVVEV
jgi:hypothetical protein